MSEKQERFVRKNYLIRKGFQIRFSLMIFITTFVIGVIAIWTTYITTWNELTTQVQSRQFYEKIRTSYEQNQDENNAAMINSLIVVEFSDIFEKVSAVLVLRLLVGAFLLFLLSIFASHKIAGPLHRMESAAYAIQKGDLSIDLSKLRAGDELTDLAYAINGAIEKLRSLMNKYRDMAQKLTELASKMSACEEGQKSTTEETAHLLKELQVVSSQLLAEINYFTTSKQKQRTAEKKKT